MRLNFIVVLLIFVSLASTTSANLEDSLTLHASKDKKSGASSVSHRRKHSNK
jgi:hypothetical protein